MENKMEIFKNEEFGSVRVIIRDNEPWFVAADVCKALELSNVTNAIKHLDEDEKALITIKGLSRGNNTGNIINEPGLYTLVLTSRKAEAKAFKRWITHSVIPTIRKHGVYITDEKVKLFAENPELLEGVIKVLYEKFVENQQLQVVTAALLPKADYYDAFIDTDTCTNIRATAKELQVSERWFTRFLQKTGFLYRAPAGNLLPYAIPRNKGLFRVKDFVRNGYGGAYTLITPAGKALFRQLIRDSGEIS